MTTHSNRAGAGGEADGSGVSKDAWGSLELPIRFDALPAEGLLRVFDGMIDEARLQVARIATQTTYEGTLGALDLATHEIDFATMLAEHLDETLGTPAYRRVYEEVQGKKMALVAELAASSELYQAIQRFAASAEAEALDSMRARFLQHTLATFRRGGADLPAPDKARLAQIDDRLTHLAVAYTQHFDDAIRAVSWHFDDANRLAGLPTTALHAAAEHARLHGQLGYRLSLQAHCFLAVMEYAEDRELRREMYLARYAVGTHDDPDTDTRAIIEEMLALRGQRAALLGFASFADFATAERMMKSGQNAMRFVQTLRDRIQPILDRETRDLVGFANTLDHPVPEAWDVAFLAERQRRARVGFDPEALRDYFPREQVLEGIFEVLRRLWGLRVVPAPSAPTWHAEVLAFDVHDEDGHFGTFYLDLYSRESKREGAWMSPVLDRTSSAAPSERNLSIAIAATDLTPPARGQPALFSHREVVRLFHEIGHVCHHLLSRVPARTLSGTRVAWDFVEFPSLLFECLAWEPEVLDLVSGHAQTGAPLPVELRDGLVRLRRYRAAGGLARQLSYATVDLDLHLHPASTPLDQHAIRERAHALFAALSPTPLPVAASLVSSFSHIFASASGYEACFYAYVWAEVLATQAVARMREDGLLSAKAGNRLRRVLSSGNGRDPMELVRECLDGEPDLGPFLEWLGVSASYE